MPMRIWRCVALLFLAWSLTVIVPAISPVVAAQELITNGGFETGDSSGWTTGWVGVGVPFCYVWQVDAACMWNPGPAAGAHYISTGFDSTGPSNFYMYQDVDIPPSGRVTFSFRYTLGLTNFSSVPREFNIQLRDPDTDDVVDTLFHREYANTEDTGVFSYETVSADMTAHTCKTLRLYFDLYVPESSTGGAQLNVDSISIRATGQGGCGVGARPNIDSDPPAPPDDRVNWQHGDLEGVVYVRRDEYGQAALHVYCLNEESRGYIGLVITEADLLGLPLQPAENILVKSSERCSIEFYVLTTGEYQINLGPDPEGKSWVIIGSGLELSNHYFFTLDPATLR